MKTFSTLPWLAMALLAATASACSGGTSISATTMSSLDTTKMIPVATAIQTALERVPGGFVVSAQLDLEDAGSDPTPENEPLSYEVVVYTPNSATVWHVGVDVATGAITEAEIEDGNEDPAN